MSAVVLASAYLNILNGYEVISRGTETNVDIEFARSLVLREADRTKLEQGGEFDTAEGNHVKWSVDINATNMPDLFTVVFTCDATNPKNAEPEHSVQTFTVLRPTWSTDAGEHDKLQQEVRDRILKMQGKQT
jgi:hypothetical protein